MSDNWIILIPEDPMFIPNEASQGLAEAKFRELAPWANEIVSSSSDTIQFQDCGANFESVTCPECSTELPMGWWQDAMDRDYVDGGFQLTPQELPCCETMATLNELNYYLTQGFGKYRLQGRNPDLGEITENQLAEFEAILGNKLRVIYQHI